MALWRGQGISILIPKRFTSVQCQSIIKEFIRIMSMVEARAIQPDTIANERA
jgi:hypothetical protein